MSVKPGHIALRKFDHDEARARHAAGETVAALAREYGVSYAAVARVVDERVRAKMHAQSARNLERRRMPCRGGCGVLVWAHGSSPSGKPPSGYCPTCHGERVREANGPNHGTESEYKAGCRCGLCLHAASDAKRRRRERSQVPCSHGCGRMVDSINRRDPSKPFECKPCSIKRVREQRKAAA